MLEVGGGSITTAGIYTAPANPAEKATKQADSIGSAAAHVQRDSRQRSIPRGGDTKHLFEFSDSMLAILERLHEN